MNRLIFAATFAICVAARQSTAFGAIITLTENTTVPTHGADLETFQRGVRHFTFDLRGSTGAGDWLGAEILVDVVNPALGRIWHASDQRLADRDVTPSDPNNDKPCYFHDLNSPSLRRNTENNANTRMYDTFFTQPRMPFVLDPLFATVGLPPSDDEPCPAGLVSTNTRLRGLSPSGAEIPLAWFDSVSNPLNDSTIARFTFEINPSAFPQPGEFVVNPADTTGATLFATLPGRIAYLTQWTQQFDFEIWWVPEPRTLGTTLLGLVLCARRRN